MGLVSCSGARHAIEFPIRLEGNLAGSCRAGPCLTPQTSQSSENRQHLGFRSLPLCLLLTATCNVFLVHCVYSKVHRVVISFSTFWAITVTIMKITHSSFSERSSVFEGNAVRYIKAWTKSLRCWLYKHQLSAPPPSSVHLTCILSAWKKKEGIFASQPNERWRCLFAVEKLLMWAATSILILLPIKVKMLFISPHEPSKLAFLLLNI